MNILTLVLFNLKVQVLVLMILNFVTFEGILVSLKFHRFSHFKRQIHPRPKSHSYLPQHFPFHPHIPLWTLHPKSCTSPIGPYTSRLFHSGRLFCPKFRVPFSIFPALLFLSISLEKLKLLEGKITRSCFFRFWIIVSWEITSFSNAAVAV